MGLTTACCCYLYRPQSQIFDDDYGKEDNHDHDHLYIIGRFCLSVTFMFIPARLDFHGSRSVFMVFHGSRLVVHGSRSVFIVPG